MAHMTVNVEYGIHSLLWLVGSDGTPVSTRDLADLQGISHSLLAKILPKLEKAGIVRASGGVRGGYLLARAAESISFLDIVDAIEGRRPLFDCQDVRRRCVLFANPPPRWAMDGLCSVHAVMLRAEKAMRDTLAGQSLAELAQAFGNKAPAEFSSEVESWFGNRTVSRTGKPRPRVTRTSNGEVLP